MAKKRQVERGPTKVCSEDYGVTSIVSWGGGRHQARHKPCEQCPWRMDVPTGVFPAEAFRASAPTAYDAAMPTFACHMSGAEKPATCAGFLLRHAAHNLGVRLSLHGQRVDLDRISHGGCPVYPDYREMAVANGVARDDEVLRQVRGPDDEWDHTERCWRARKP